jgi:hypothetical protein
MPTNPQPRQKATASLELHNKTDRVVFRYAPRKDGYSLDTGDQQTAKALRGGVEKTLMLIEQKATRLTTCGRRPRQFVQNDGKRKAQAPAGSWTNAESKRGARCVRQS